jgi:hypothetical protein
MTLNHASSASVELLWKFGLLLLLRRTKTMSDRDLSRPDHCTYAVLLLALLLRAEVSVAALVRPSFPILERQSKQEAL